MIATQQSGTSRGFVIAATGSGSGKTTLTLGLLRALARRGLDVAGAKCGPDYIDPRFHEAACGAPCPNLDAFAMSPDRIKALAPKNELVIVEGVMGLFDGTAEGAGSTAHLARILQLPVILVVDCARMAQSVAALVHGFALFDAHVQVAAVILNNVGSDRHEAMLRTALGPLDIPVVGAVRRAPDLQHPSRHLGLVQAGERDDLDAFIDKVADHVASCCDLDRLTAIAAPLAQSHDAPCAPTAPAKRIAIAQDEAFAFAYPHLLDDWRAAGAALSFFSPLGDEPPAPADLIFLPGGYPELHAARLAAATTFRDAMRAAARSGTQVYGECGGYMALGETLIDADGQPHAMLGLLDLVTSFQKRKLHLGYRTVKASTGPFAGLWAAHEFHYASTLKAQGTPLFKATDAWGRDLGELGLVKGTVSGSFVHLIDLGAMPNEISTN